MYRVLNALKTKTVMGAFLGRPPACSLLISLGRGYGRIRRRLGRVARAPLDIAVEVGVHVVLRHLDDRLLLLLQGASDGASDGGVGFALGVLDGGPEGGRCRRDAAFCGVLGLGRVRFFSSRCLFCSPLWERGLECRCAAAWVRMRAALGGS